MVIEEIFVFVKFDGVVCGFIGMIFVCIEVKGYVFVDICFVEFDCDLFVVYYVEYEGKLFYELLIEFMFFGLFVVICLVGNCVIEGFCFFVGMIDFMIVVLGMICGDFGRDWGFKV